LLSYPNALSNSKFFYLFLDQLNIVSWGILGKSINSQQFIFEFFKKNLGNKIFFLLSYPNALSNSKFFYLFLVQLNIVSLQNTSRRQNELEENLAGRNPKVEP
jgi:hypothetical protein